MCIIIEKAYGHNIALLSDNDGTEPLTIQIIPYRRTNEESFNDDNWDDL